MSGRATVKWPRALLALGIALATLAQAGEVPASKTIMFVCLHGSVKSQMAAAHFNRIARAGGLPCTAVSRGIEIDHSIPTRIRDGLSLDGFAPLDDVLQPLTPAEAATAIKVIAFDAVPDEKRSLEQLNDFMECGWLAAYPDSDLEMHHET